MNKPHKNQNKTIVTPQPQSHTPRSAPEPSVDITDEMITTINQLSNGLQHYPIRTMVEQSQKFGPYLKNQRLETNQVRKFLDALNRIKVKFARITLDTLQAKTDLDSSEALSSESHRKQEKAFAALETDIVLLKPKLAYAAARQKSAIPLSKVMSCAIDKVHSVQDFQRLTQLIESIIAYHKAEGGK